MTDRYTSFGREHFKDALAVQRHDVMSVGASVERLPDRLSKGRWRQRNRYSHSAPEDFRDLAKVQKALLECRGRAEKPGAPAMKGQFYEDIVESCSNCGRRPTPGDILGSAVEYPEELIIKCVCGTAFHSHRDFVGSAQEEARGETLRTTDEPEAGPTSHVSDPATRLDPVRRHLLRTSMRTYVDTLANDGLSALNEKTRRETTLAKGPAARLRKKPRQSSAYGLANFKLDPTPEVLRRKVHGKDRRILRPRNKRREMLGEIQEKCGVKKSHIYKGGYHAALSFLHTP